MLHYCSLQTHTKVTKSPPGHSLSPAFDETTAVALDLPSYETSHAVCMLPCHFLVFHLVIQENKDNEVCNCFLNHLYA